MTDHVHHSYGSEVMSELIPLARDMRRAIPDVMNAFSSLSAAVMKDGALDGKTKELIALALSIGERCDGCINTHARKAVKRGATEAEVGEAIGVAILMTGGPATVYGPRAFAAFREYAAQEQPSSDS